MARVYRRVSPERRTFCAPNSGARAAPSPLLGPPLPQMHGRFASNGSKTGIRVRSVSHSSAERYEQEKRLKYLTLDQFWFPQHRRSNHADNDHNNDRDGVATPPAEKRPGFPGQTPHGPISRGDDENRTRIISLED